MLRIRTLFALVLLAPPVFAQGQLKGSVKDTTGRPVPGAQVAVAKLEKTITTDDSGQYVLRDLPAGSHLMNVRRTGYRPTTAIVELGDKEVVTRDFVLVAGAVELDTVRAAERPKIRPSRTVMSGEQIIEGHYENVFGAIEALHPNWLKARGTTSFSGGDADKVWVYQDNVKLGDVESLRSIPPMTVVAVRYFDANAAQARFGVGHPAGAILVETTGFNKKEP